MPASGFRFPAAFVHCSNLISVCTHTDSPRLRYVLDFLSGYFAVPFRQVTEPADAVVGYGVSGSFTITPGGLLEERGIRPLDPAVATHPAGFPVLFPNDGPLGFDLFSAIFYLLSRYEEYGTVPLDEYGRFHHTASVAQRHGFLQRPLIHEWLACFARFLGKDLQVPAFRFLPTYDIDMAWSYRHKGAARNAAGLLRSVLSGRKAEVHDRLRVLRGHAADPFDCFPWLDERHTQHDLSPVYFIHAGRQRGRYDKNIPLTHPSMGALVHRLASRYRIGLHPSWRSGDLPIELQEEKKLLEAVIEQPVLDSRQHYIRMNLPGTYRALLQAGIAHDYSMGYGSVNGFRASLSVPFYWYDLEREEATALLLHPFCFMDANAFYEQQQNVEETGRELEHYTDILRQHGGTLITIWHNTILGSAPEFAGWAELYARFLQRVTSLY